MNKSHLMEDYWKVIEVDDVFNWWNHCRNMWLYYTLPSDAVFEQVKAHIKNNPFIVTTEYPTGMEIFFLDSRDVKAQRMTSEKLTPSIYHPHVTLFNELTSGMAAKSLRFSFEESGDNEERQIFVKWFMDNLKPIKVLIES